jgi:hypothetical protein
VPHAAAAASSHRKGGVREKTNRTDVESLLRKESCRSGSLYNIRKLIRMERKTTTFLPEVCVSLSSFLIL